jgi:16S rRNA (uracil1498-N3)-methyltransferase
MVVTLHRFFVTTTLASNADGLLAEVQTHQARRVLRLKPGDEIAIFDGSGVETVARLGQLEGARWRFHAGELSRPLREPPIHLVVGLGLLRNERFDLAVQKLTELGVAEIAPLAAERCVVSYPDARNWEKRRARLERIIVEAAEQSERLTLPNLRDPLSVSSFLDLYGEATIIALVERTRDCPLHELEPGRKPVLAVGPEGGWSPDELALLSERHVLAASLGNLILRAETAAIVAAGYLAQRSLTSQGSDR